MAKNNLNRPYAVACGILGLVPLLIVLKLGTSGFNNWITQRDYREAAVPMPATVQGFRSTTHQVGRETVIHHQMIVKYQDGSREITVPLRNLHEINPAEQPAWLGREIQILRLPGQQGSEIHAADRDLLPSAFSMLNWMPAPALMLGVCIYLAITLWRKKDL